MNAELKAKWIEALRSGRYKQGRGFLRNANDEYCCLGVLCDVFDHTKWSQPLPGKAFHYESQRMVPPGCIIQVGDYARMNDIEKKSFNEIADFVEANE